MTTVADARQSIFGRCFQEGELLFCFPKNWIVAKLDNANFYLKHFQSLAGGSKAVDFVAIPGEENILWLIEVKDYCNPGARNRLADSESRMLATHSCDVAKKVRDSIAALVVMRAQSADKQESEFAAKALADNRRLRVAFHAEFPQEFLFSIPSWLQNLEGQFKPKIKPVDSSPMVGDATNSRWHWNVKRQKAAKTACDISTNPNDSD